MVIIGVYYQNWRQMLSNDVEWRENEKNNIVDIKWSQETIKFEIKPIKSGIVVIYSSNTSDLGVFYKNWLKLTFKMTSNDVKMKKTS